MKSTQALRELSDVTGSQWGLVTSKQAERLGVSRLNLSRLEAQGQLERVRQGVYRDNGSPASKTTELRAHWLSFNPALLAHERIKNLESEAIVAGATAAWLRNEGEFRPEPFTFYYPRRSQKAATGIKVKKAQVANEDIDLSQGIPATNKTRTVIDLFKEGRDLGSMEVLMRDAGLSGLDIQRLRESTVQISTKYGIAAKSFALQLEQMLLSAPMADFQRLGIQDFSEIKRVSDELGRQLKQMSSNITSAVLPEGMAQTVDSFKRLQEEITKVTGPNEK